ncbi:hypothetical protein [Mycolicibacterium sp. PDY-3]|uniref:hypothetical protein n=1 Tax=Mycolicibacterium sp. PDY-3 TaxID=3376069 RepID=UPI00379B36E6
MEELEHQVIIMDSGEQIPVTTSPGTVASFYVGSDRPKETVVLDVTNAEFAKIEKQAISNRIPKATLIKKKEWTQKHPSSARFRQYGSLSEEFPLAYQDMSPARSTRCSVPRSLPSDLPLSNRRSLSASVLG